MTIEDKILKYIDNHDYVTYRELEVFFENSGKMCIRDRPRNGLILYSIQFS